MPIFFHIESHVWILYLFVANGLIVTWLLRSKFESFRVLTVSLESQLLSAFFISLGINGLSLLILDWLSIDFYFTKWSLIFLACILIPWLSITMVKSDFSAFHFEIGLARLALYIFVFIVLFYNGGLIEQVSDAWWHMSLANKISVESTYSPTLGHLHGLPTRYYPPLWHGNLALAKLLSGVPIEIFWNSLTAWVGMFKVMAFYLFTYSLSKNQKLAILAAILFVLLPGVGVSYLRVSAWPSHIAYTAWYAMFSVFILLLDNLPREDQKLRQSLLPFLGASATKLVILLVLSTLIYFTHKAEVLWFSVAWFSYLVAASLSRLLSPKHEYIIERDHYLLIFFYRCILIALILYCSWFAATQEYHKPGMSDQLLAYLLPVVLSSILILLDFKFKSKAVAYCLLLVFLVLILGSVNYIHLYSLFVPELALPKGAFFESSSVAIGYLGGELKAPSWRLQLRAGLLYSGIFSVFIATVALVIKPTRLSILTAGTGCLALLFCVSPYLYHWLQSVLNYHSPWRISLIIFHPIVWALVLVSFNQIRINAIRAGK